MSIRDDHLEARLRQWASEYRDHPTRAWTILCRLIEHQGFVPDSRGFIPVPVNTKADEIERIVTAMEKSGMFVSGRVLRCEYFDKHSPTSARLEHLRALGLPMSQRGYYLHLDKARAFVAGALAIVPAKTA